METPTSLVEVYESPDKYFHFQLREKGRPNQKHNPTMCGLDVRSLRRVAWFDVGDPRGRVHYERACPICGQQLSY